MNLSIDKCELSDRDKLEISDRWILSEYNDLVKEVTDNLDKYELWDSGFKAV